MYVCMYVFDWIWDDATGKNGISHTRRGNGKQRGSRVYNSIDGELCDVTNEMSTAYLGLWKKSIFYSNEKALDISWNAKLDWGFDLSLLLETRFKGTHQIFWTSWIFISSPPPLTQEGFCGFPTSQYCPGAIDIQELRNDMNLQQQSYFPSTKSSRLRTINFPTP